MQRYQGKVVNRWGDGMSGVNVNVYQRGTTARVGIFSDNGVTLTTNPLPSGANGDFQFWAGGGNYDVNWAASGDISLTTTQVSLLDTSNPVDATVFSYDAAGNPIGLVGTQGVVSLPYIQNANTPAQNLTAINYQLSTYGYCGLERGTNQISGALVMPSNSVLEGRGIGVSVIKLANSSNTNVLQNLTTTGSGNSNITVRELSVDGNVANQSGSGATAAAGDAESNHNGLYLVNTPQLILSNLEVYNCDGTGLLLLGYDATPVIVGDGQISNIYTHHNATDGFHVGAGFRRVSKKSLMAHHNGRYGLVFDASENQADSVKANQNTRDGVYFRNAFACGYQNISANLNGRHGIHVLGYVESVGVNWDAHLNGRSASAHDIYFNQDATWSYGITANSIVSMLNCGPYSIGTSWAGDASASGVTEQYGLLVDTNVSALTLFGVRCDLAGLAGTISIPSSSGLNMVDFPASTKTMRMWRGNLKIIEGDFSHGTGNLGFFNTTAIAKPTVTGAKGGNAALTSLMTQLAALGLVTDSTT